MNAARPRRIVCTTDFSENAAAAVPVAAGLAERHGAELTVLHVITPADELFPPEQFSPAYQVYRDAVEQSAQRKLDELEVPNVGRPVFRAITRASSAVTGVSTYADEHDVDLIVVGSHGRRLLGQIMLGSVARGVIAESPCAVLCVKRTDHGLAEAASIAPSKILFATDLSSRSVESFDVAAELAKTSRATLIVLHVVVAEAPPIYGMPLLQIDAEIRTRIKDRLQDLVSRAGDDGIEAVLEVGEGTPSKEIARHASVAAADLIVLSRSGAGKTRHLLGGVPERLLHDAHCPVLVL